MQKAASSWADKWTSKIDKSKAQEDALLNSVDETTRKFLQKDPKTWDKYDIAFKTLNPDVESMARKYRKMREKRLELENERVNLESARDFMNQIYAEQKANINDSYDNANKATALWNNIALWSALSSTWSVWANAIQDAALVAQAQNAADAQMLQNEAARDQALATANTNEANMPQLLAQIWAQNENLDATNRQLDLQEKQLNQQKSYYSSNRREEQKDTNTDKWTYKDKSAWTKWVDKDWKVKYTIKIDWKTYKISEDNYNKIWTDKQDSIIKALEKKINENKVESIKDWANEWK